MTKFVAFPLDRIFCKNSTYTAPLSFKVLKENLLEYKCVACSNGGIWFNKKLTLQLDHINGVGNDNRIENLRFLCPNCHSQTPTYSGRNAKKYKNIEKKDLKNIEIYCPQISFRQKKNEIWNIPTEQLKKVTEENNCFSDILKIFGFALKGAQYKALKERLFWENIKFDHIVTGHDHNKGKKYPRPSISLNLVLKENSSYPRYLLKKRLLEENFLKNECSICKLKAMWYDMELCLQLDHINGISNDNRLENLRILCPNCHSQTPTYAGKNNEKHRKNNICT